MRNNKFTIALFLMVFLAWFLPGPALYGDGVPLKVIGRVGISLIFFFYGLKLGREKFISSINKIKLYVTIQLTTFILFPVFVLLFYPLMATEVQRNIWLAMFFLSALPSTIAASVVLVSLAKGNEPAAIFNSSLSGIVGILVTPLWMGIFLKTHHADFVLTDIFLRLILEIILPVCVGLILRPRFAGWVKKNALRLSILDKSVIALIVYKSFSDSFSKGLFGEIGIFNLIVIVVLAVSLFVIAYSLLFFISRKLKFNKEDRITCIISGSMKSLIHGTVFANVIFGTMPTAGLMLLPIMIYHSFQIFFIGIIATRYNNRLF